MDAESRIQELSGALNGLRRQVEELERQMAALDDDIAETGSGRREETGSSLWSGKVISWDGTVLLEVDLENMDNVIGTHIVYDPKEDGGDPEFSDGPQDDKYSWHVADEVDDGEYILSQDTSGDIIVPIPEGWKDRQVLQTDKDKKLLMEDLKIVGDKEDEETGFEFVKPENDEEGLAQMKPLNATAKYYLCCADGKKAHWVDIPSPIITGISADFRAENNTLILEITPEGKEIKDDGTWQAKEFAKIIKVVAGGACT